MVEEEERSAPNMAATGGIQKEFSDQRSKQRWVSGIRVDERLAFPRARAVRRSGLRPFRTAGSGNKFQNLCCVHSRTRHVPNWGPGSETGLVRGRASLKPGKKFRNMNELGGPTHNPAHIDVVRKGRRLTWFATAACTEIPSNCDPYHMAPSGSAVGFAHAMTKGGPR